MKLNKIHWSRLKRVTSVVLIALLGIVLILNALRQNINLYLTPTELLDKQQTLLAQGKMIRLGGLVLVGSHQALPNLEHVFMVSDGQQSIKVAYKGLLPDLFKEKQGVVTEGYLNPAGDFRAVRVLAKHDENYHPPGIPKNEAV